MESEVKLHDEKLEPEKLQVEERSYHFYDSSKATSEAYSKLPYSIRVLLECSLRKWAECETSGSKEELALAWKDSAAKLLNFRHNEGHHALFHPGRVVLQDFTGVPALVDLAAVRNVVAEKVGAAVDLSSIDSSCPADLVVDHSVQVDFSHIANSVKKEKAELRKRTPPPATPQQFPPPPQANHLFQPQSSNQCVPIYPPAIQQQQPLHQPSCQYTAPPSLLCPPPHQVVLYPAPIEVVEPRGSIPNDNPGLPIQDDICPFHQRLSYWAPQLEKSRANEFKKNGERFEFLKWSDSAFANVTVIPPGTGVLHGVNLEYLARVVTVQKGLLFPDSLIGTDSHTTIVNGLGVLGWTVSTLDAECVMFGHPVALSIPKVVGCRVVGKPSKYATSTDIVLHVTKRLRSLSKDIAGSLVEFFGEGVKELSIGDRMTIANMCSEYGAQVGYFPVDETTFEYLSDAGREKIELRVIREYLDKVGVFRKSSSDEEIEYSSVVDINLSDIGACLSGPKSIKEKVRVENLRQHFKTALTTTSNVTEKNLSTIGGFNVPVERMLQSICIDIDGFLSPIRHGTILEAAITSCTNSSNPRVMLAAGLLAKNAVLKGLNVPKFVKTSLAPGSGVVSRYLQDSGVMPYLNQLGFEIIGYGCTACVENSYKVSKPVKDGETAAVGGNLVCCGILSGNRNFENRIRTDKLKANYLASPLFVLAFAIAGRIDIDFENEPLGFQADGSPIFLDDIWPSRNEIKKVEQSLVIPSIYRQAQSKIDYGNKEWSAIETKDTATFSWTKSSTFLQRPSYVADMAKTLEKTQQDSLKGMRCLLKLGDDVAGDMISPAGSIVRNTPAGDYLTSVGLTPREFNSFGARRGNSEVMIRGAFSNAKIVNALSSKAGPYTTHFPSEVPTTVYEAAVRYKKSETPLFIIAGKEFGRGAANRDWAAKGPLALGVKAVLAVSFDKAYRSHLIRAGLLPVEIDEETYEILTGREELTILLPKEKRNGTPRKFNKNGGGMGVKLMLYDGEFDLMARAKIANAYEEKIYREGGILKSYLREKLNEAENESNVQAAAAS